ncbi:MAG TPA: M23 family metallopeptidase [Sporichthyaceae bacterium]|nr:M23 family metallopeptidase [Sporichthyaceae bacterium]
MPAPAVATPAPVIGTTVPSGRRRQAPAVEAPLEVPATGNGRRRRVVAEPEVGIDPAAVVAIHAAAAKRAVAAKHGVTPKPPVAQPEGRPAPKVAVVPTIPDVDAPVPVADVIPIEAAASHRHRARRSFPIPGNPALVAGAAAVAIAAVGVVASTAGGSNVSAADADLARAAVPGLDQPVVHTPAAPDPTAAARASRDHARQLLALRLKNDAKQDALEKALKLAAQRATRLAALAKEFFLPVKGYHLTAGFGEGGGLWAHGHTGQDFACPTGTPIHALASGTIVYTGWYGAYGWLTVERLADNTEIWYAHQSKILVHSGPVVAGQEIGHVGSTGNTTGPHLHLEVHPQGGPPVDPMPWLRAHGMHP